MLTCLEERRVVDVVLKVLLLLLPELANDNKVASMLVSGDATFECSSLISTTRGLTLLPTSFGGLLMIAS